MNLSITNLCNRRCDYCFQKTWYLSKKAYADDSVKEISLDEFDKFLDWLGEKNREVKLMGGEPLLHSKIDELLSIADKKDKGVVLISNISVDPEIMDKVLEHKNIISFLVNTDYPDSQKEVFFQNLEKITKEQVNREKQKFSISLSSTLLPNENELLKSANRLASCLELIKQYRNIDDFGISVRLSPYCPMPNEKFIPFDYSTILANFFNVVWKHGVVDTNFDCTVNKDEINDQAYKAYRSAGINIDRENCTCERGMPLDILIDGSVIWCSSCNFIRLNSWKDYDSLETVTEVLREKWYEEFHKFNIEIPDFNTGFCLAKTLTKKNNEFQIKMFK